MRTALRYLLDTDICIYIANRRSTKILERLEQLAPGEVGMSVITYGELCYGASKSLHRVKSLRVLHELREWIPVLPTDEKIGEHYGKIRGALELKGQVIGNNDLWIAAHALALEVTLVSNNTREFKRVPGLVSENWT